ncbi:hypothetical protein DL764_004705 [Monosporascus ibericus]|uniref:FAD dependent oxidoreductase domain-containing protein n=1 Tax=Monosporascus ibericus TaxID=155417 RepID=A0A4Q4TBT1_9PEZI|nr:hypothetical protein DL764_004705 [Monosporascus ibericus]
MMLQQLQPWSKGLTVGSSVFGISTALWLARSGYRDVGVLRMQRTGLAATDYRYGPKITYQRFATEAAAMLDEWSGALAAGAASAALEEEERELPPCSRHGDWRLWLNRRVPWMSSRLESREFELQILESMEKEGIRESQFRNDDESGEPDHMEGWFFADYVPERRGSPPARAGAGTGLKFVLVPGRKPRQDTRG